MSDTAVKIRNLKKQYRLGAIDGTTLNAELQSWWARKRGKEDPNLKIGQDYVDAGGIFLALDGIDLEVKKGEALGIIGANGAGKSTLLKILSRVTAPTEGDIWINGRVSSMLEVGTGFHGELTGRENIYMNGAILGMTKKEVDQKIDSIIDFSECQQFIDTPVKRYSSGMYVKLAFAVASHLDSEIMIMDEVLAVGDMKFQKKCLGRMGDAAGNEGRTVLYVSHNMATIRNLCTRCVVLNKGRLIFDGDVEEAIAVYMEQTDGELLSRISINDQKRSAIGLGDKIRISELDFCEKVLPSFTTQEKMQMHLKLKAYDDIEEYRIRMEVKYVDDSIVGMSESHTVGQLSKGEEKDITIALNMKNFAEGTYWFRLSLFKLDMMGGHCGLDEIPQKIYFKVVDTIPNRTGWLRQYWGNVRLDAVEII